MTLDLSAPPSSALAPAERACGPYGPQGASGARGADGAYAARPTRRVLYVEANVDGTVGGSHQALFDLVRHVPAAGVEPVVVFYQRNVFVDRLGALGVEVHVLDEMWAREKHVYRTGRTLAKVRTLAAAIRARARFLRERRIDLVHLNNSPQVGYDDWLPAARIAGRPCVVSAMGLLLDRDHGIIQRRLVAGFDHVLSCSRYIADDVAGRGYRNGRNSVVHLGIDLAAFRARVTRDPAAVRRELGVDADTMLAVMVGNVREWKGQHVVLEALGQLPPALRARMRVLFAGAVAAGDVEYKRALDSRVAALGLADTVRFLGSRPDVPDLMNAADAVLHASVTPEPFGLVITEGMALGKTVVAAASGGPTEILDARSGLLHDTARPEQLAAHLRVLLEEPELRHRIGAAALARVEAFSIHETVRKTVAIYSDLLRR